MSLDKTGKHGKEKKAEFKAPKRTIKNPLGFTPGMGGKMSLNEIGDLLEEEDMSREEAMAYHDIKEGFDHI